MKTRHLARWAGACTRVAMLSALAGFAAANATQYERMAPLKQYLMSSDSEIALARSAAPAAISDKSHGPDSRFAGLPRPPSAAPTDSLVSWRGRGCRRSRAPISGIRRSGDRFAANPAASGSILTYTRGRTKLALAGDSREKILDEVRAALARNEAPLPPGPGAMSFMMSKDGYLVAMPTMHLAPPPHVPCAKGRRRWQGSKPAGVIR